MRIDGGTFTASAELALHLAADGAATASGTAALGAAGRAAALAPATASTASSLTAGPAHAAWIVPAGKGEIQRPAIGYAKAAVTSASSSTAAKATVAAAKATVSSPLDFLRDSRLTAEEKLVLLLAQQQKDVEKEIETVIKKAEAKSATKVSGGGGGILGGLKVLDVVKSAVPALGLVEKAFGDGAITRAVRQLGGPVLAAAATALGAPQLAPIAMSMGPDLIAGALEADLPFGSSAAPRAASPNAPQAGTGSSNALDPVEAQKLTLLVNRQQQWAGMVSNMLHALHQTRMNVIQNLR